MNGMKLNGGGHPFLPHCPGHVVQGGRDRLDQAPVFSGAWLGTEAGRVVPTSFCLRPSCSNLDRPSGRGWEVRLVNHTRLHINQPWPLPIGHGYCHQKTEASWEKRSEECVVTLRAAASLPPSREAAPRLSWWNFRWRGRAPLLPGVPASHCFPPLLPTGK